jgi:hypothetical protein
MNQKVITNIQLGVVQDKVAWVFEYANAPNESFSLHLPVAKQFVQGMHDLIQLLEEQRTAPPSGTKSGVGMADSVSVRLVG